MNKRAATCPHVLFVEELLDPEGFIRKELAKPWPTVRDRSMKAKIRREAEK